MISSENNRYEFTGDGATVTWPYPYRFLATDHLVAYIDGVEVEVLNATGAGGPAGGDVTLDTAAALGVKGVIVNAPPALQDRDFEAAEDPPADAYEGVADLLTLLVQAVKKRVTRALAFGDGVVLGAFDPVMNAKPAAGTVPRVKDDGSAIEWVASTTQGAASIPLGYLDTDAALAANSDAKVASQKAVKTYIAAQIAAAVAALKDGVSTAFDTLAEIATDLGTRALKATAINVSGLVTGGGTLAADRTITVTAASASEARAMTASDKALVPSNLADVGVWQTIAASAVAVSHTGNTTETALATITIPAGRMGANGRLRITTLWTYTNSANVKTPRVRLGGMSGTAFLLAAPSTNATAQVVTEIANRNSQSSQIGTYAAHLAGSYGASTPAAVTGAVDTSVAADIVISGQLNSAGETITLEGYLVEVLKKS